MRAPWGITPAYIDRQISDQDMANLVAHFDALPGVATPGAWRVPVPAGAPPDTPRQALEESSQRRFDQGARGGDDVGYRRGEAASLR